MSQKSRLNVHTPSELYMMTRHDSTSVGSNTRVPRTTTALALVHKTTEFEKGDGGFTAIHFAALSMHINSISGLYTGIC